MVKSPIQKKFKQIEYHTQRKEELKKRKKNKYMSSFFISSLKNFKKEIRKFKKLSPEERQQTELTKGLLALVWVSELYNTKGKTKKEIRVNRNRINEKYLSKIHSLKLLKR